MKLKFSNKKIKRTLERSVCLAMCIVCMVGFCCSSYADISAYKFGKGYKWTRIRSWEDLKAFGVENSDRSITSDSGWIKAMIVADDKYYIEGERIRDNGEHYINRYSENERYRMSYIPVTSGFKPDQDEFMTTSGLNAPYIKFRGMDDDNKDTKSAYFMLRMSRDDELGRQVWLLNCAFYGVAYHASYYSEIRFCDKNNITACSHTISSADRVREEMDIMFNDEGYMGMYYNVPGVSDRYIARDGENGLETTSSAIYTAAFKLYLGVPYDVPIQTLSGSVAVGETTVWNGMIVGRNTRITVPKGATLIVDGYTYNNGEIFVNGGTLIVKGVLDTNDGQPHSREYSFAPGALVLDNGGLVYVEESGVIIQRHQDADVSIRYNSTMVVDGALIVGGSLSVSDHSAFRASPGTFIAIGAIAKNSIEQSKYTPNYIAEYKDCYMDQLISDSPASVVGKSIGLYVYGHSSAYFDQFYMGTSKRSAEISRGSYWYGIRNSNIHATVKSMVTL